MKRNSLDTKKLDKCLRNSSESLCFVESFLFDQESRAMFIYQPIRAKGLKPLRTTALSENHKVISTLAFLCD